MNVMLNVMKKSFSGLAMETNVKNTIEVSYKDLIESSPFKQPTKPLLSAAVQSWGGGCSGAVWSSPPTYRDPPRDSRSPAGNIFFLHFFPIY